MKQWLLLFFCVFLCDANAQDHESFEELVHLYTEFIFEDNAKALAYAVKAKEVAILNDNKEQLVKTSYYIAKCQHLLEKNSIALQTIETAVAQNSKVQDQWFLYKCLLLKGDILFELGADSKALLAYVEAKKYAEKQENYLYEIAPMLSIAAIKKKHKDFDEVIVIYKNILKALKTLGDTPNTNYYKIIALMNIADAYLWMKQPEEANIYNKAGLNACSKRDSLNYFPLLMNKAIIFYQKASYDDCILVAKEVQNYSETKNKNLYATSLFYIGKSHYELAAYKETIQYLEKAHIIINANDDVDANEKELHEFLALAYLEENNPEKHLFHFQKYAALEKKQNLKDIQINNETHELVDMSPLKTEIENLGTALAKQTRSKKGFIIVAVSLLLLLFGSVFYYRLREKSTKKKFRGILKKVTELERDQGKKSSSRKQAVSDENVKLILDRIDSFEKQKYYLATACNLSFMAEKLDTNATYLSKVINRYKGKSFTAYITELRINNALIRLKNDKKLQSYTIKAIAEEFGFKRQETFSRAFKAQTGIHPSQYLKNL
ncbi:MAG: helix-turn-helix domain-containing protein [Bacteroidota bacterium]